MKFEVQIIETTVSTVVVEANSASEAATIAASMNEAGSISDQTYDIDISATREEV